MSYIEPTFAKGHLSSVLVAASDASDSDKLIADYVCTGTSDDVFINDAIGRISTNGGTVYLSGGTFNLASTINLSGGSNDTNNVNLSLIGQGNETTLLKPASGVHGITITNDPKVDIEDIYIYITGASDGIHAIAPTTGSLRGFWNSYFKNIMVQGDNSTSTGYVMYMQNPFRSTFINIEGLNVKNGLFMTSMTTAFNPGNLIFMRCFMDLGIANGTAYSLIAPTSGGYFNICTFIQCEAIDSSGASTTSVGWYLNGNSGSYFNVRNIKVIQSNMEGFNTSVELIYAIDNFIQLDYADVTSGGTIFSVDANSTNNELSCTTSSIGNNNTMKLLNDLNGDSLLPTVMRRFECYVGTSGTLSITPSSATVLEHLFANGGTGAVIDPIFASGFRMPSNYIQGALTVPTGISNSIAGIATLASGTVTVNTTSVTANSQVMLTRQTAGGTVGELTVGTITAGTSFVINSASATDTSTVAWFIIN